MGVWRLLGVKHRAQSVVQRADRRVRLKGRRWRLMSRARWPDSSSQHRLGRKGEKLETKNQVTIRRENPWSQGNEHFEEASPAWPNLTRKTGNLRSGVCRRASRRGLALPCLGLNSSVVEGGQGTNLLCRHWGCFPTRSSQLLRRTPILLE